ncbi:MAG: esterase [Burkholderiaceae bacterium]|nr:esterase [Burkholderiaceae bacterium]
MLIYLHGFRSSPDSFKGRMLGEVLAARGSSDRYACPALPVSPSAAIELIESSFALGPGDTLVGSSLGGYYATWLAERHGCRAVLLNPAIEPAQGLRAYVGTQTMYHSGAPFEFRAEYLAELAAIEAGPITRPQRYLLIAATGDELLDWRDMTARYAGARQVVIPGSDHGLSDFADHLETVLAFAGLGPGGPGN